MAPFYRQIKCCKQLQHFFFFNQFWMFSHPAESTKDQATIFSQTREQSKFWVTSNILKKAQKVSGYSANKRQEKAGNTEGVSSRSAPVNGVHGRVNLQSSQLLSCLLSPMAKINQGSLLVDLKLSHYCLPWG